MKNKNVLFHIDDFWASQSSNRAWFDLLKKWYVKSWSVMVPCNWFDDAAKTLKTEKDIDMWVHLTLTSEWDFPYQQWGPTLHAKDVPSLVNKKWLFYKTTNEVLCNANYEDIKKEICNQIRITFQILK